MRNLIKLFLLTMCLFTSSFAFQIGPTVFDKRIDGEGAYQEFEITNDTFDKQRYKIDISGVENKEFKNWVEIYPKVLTIEPKSSKKFKVLIKAPNNTPNGEYKFVVSPTAIKVPILNKNKENNKNQITLQGEMTLAIALEMRAYVGDLGDIKNDIQIKNIKKDGDTLRFEVKNNLDRSFLGYYEIIDSYKNSLLTGEIGRIEKNEVKNVKTEKFEIKKAKEIVIYDGSSLTPFLRVKI